RHDPDGAGLARDGAEDAARDQTAGRAARGRAEGARPCLSPATSSAGRKRSYSVRSMSDDESTDTKPDHEPPRGAASTGTWNDIAYTATAKWLVLRRKEKPSAEIFSVSYVADSADLDRPVTFVFNGGPGASSAYLHVGAVGPQRVDFPADG